MDNDKDNMPIVKSDNDMIQSDKKSIKNYDEKFVDALDRISKSARANNRYRVVMLIIIAIALFSILFLIGFVSFHLISANQKEEPPLVAMEIRALNRIETLFVEIPVMYKSEDTNVTEYMATTGYGVYTVDLDQATIEETDKYIDITIASPELTTVDIYANQNQILSREEATGVQNGFSQLINGNDYSDGFSFVADRNVALKEELRSMLESDEYEFLRRQAESQAVSVISNFVHSIDAYPVKRDVRIHFE